MSGKASETPTRSDIKLAGDQHLLDKIGAGRWPKYPDYKDSGVNWLGEIPQHWEKVPLKYIVKIPVTDGPHETPDLVEEGIPFISAEAVKNRGLDFSRKRGYITQELHDEFCKKCSPQRGDIFMVKSGNTTGAVAMVETDELFSIWSPLALIRTNPKLIDTRFLFHVMNADFFQRSVQLFWSHGTQPNIGMNVIGNLITTLPTQDEQKPIADFLDYETAWIDDLIAKKQRLIELLQEKRTALISQAVTKGLNPHAPMKDSGIDWLGKIPAHWEVAQLRRFVNFITSGSRGWAEHYADTGSIFVRIGNLTRDSIGVSLEDVQYVDPPLGAEGERTRIKSGDILFSITAYLGSVAVASPSLVNAYINQHIALVRVGKDRIASEFCAFLAFSQVGQAQLNGQAYGGTKIQLALDDVKSLWLTVPPLAEQVIIAEYLKAKMAKFDQMASKIEEAIKRLQEYRTALISAAVTGKIDVRQLVKNSSPHDH